MNINRIEELKRFITRLHKINDKSFCFLKRYTENNVLTLVFNRSKPLTIDPSLFDDFEKEVYVDTIDTEKNVIQYNFKKVK